MEDDIPADKMGFQNSRQTFFTQFIEDFSCFFSVTGGEIFFSYSVGCDLFFCDGPHIGIEIDGVGVKYA